LNEWTPELKGREEKSKKGELDELIIMNGFRII
jgi:hypothetical protein